MNHTEMPLANLIGHGDARAYSLEEINGFCDKAGLKIEKLEKGIEIQNASCGAKAMIRRPA